MTELDQIWSEMLKDAAARAGDSGRQEVSDYLRLKATNDAIRQTGVGWLFETVIGIALQSDVKRPVITIERDDPHNFARGASNMVGSRISVRRGVRCLTVEAGWARTPGDGIMLKGALAFARITHFGMPKAGAELDLVHVQTLPQWMSSDGIIVDSNWLLSHFEILLAD